MNNLAPLYELTGKYLQLANTLSELDLDAQTIQDTIEASGITDDIGQKAVGIEMMARGFEMSTPAIDAEIARLTALKMSRTKRAQGLREYLKSNMIACGIDKIYMPLFKIRLQNNPESVDIFEPGLVPTEYMRQPEMPPPSPDKSAIKAAFKAGYEVQGCRMTQSQRLVVS